jgi:TrpR-related protein YerC/YecD
MSKIKFYSVPKKERYQLIGEFFDIVYSLRTKREIIDFFVGLLTTSESIMVARRIQVAKFIIQGEKYDEIRKRLGVGYQTIYNVNRWLHERDDAYLKVLNKQFDLSKKKVRNKKVRTYNEQSLLDRYPQHRLMKKLLGL